METFFCDEDYQAYLSLLVAWCPQNPGELLGRDLLPKKPGPKQKEPN